MGEIMMKNKQIEENVYKCQDCKSIWNEKDLGSVKIDNYYRLFCNFCQSENIKLIVGNEL